MRGVNKQKKLIFREPLKRVSSTEKSKKCDMVAERNILNRKYVQLWRRELTQAKSEQEIPDNKLKNRLKKWTDERKNERQNEQINSRVREQDLARVFLRAQRTIHVQN